MTAPEPPRDGPALHAWYEDIRRAYATAPDGTVARQLTCDLAKLLNKGEFDGQA